MRKRFLRSALSLCISAALLLGDAGIALAMEPSQVAEAQQDYDSTEETADDIETTDEAEVTEEVEGEATEEVTEETTEEVTEEATEEITEETTEEATTEEVAEETTEEATTEEVAEETTEEATTEEVTKEATEEIIEEVELNTAAADVAVNSISVNAYTSTYSGYVYASISVKAAKYAVYINNKLYNTYTGGTYTVSGTTYYYDYSNTVYAYIDMNPGTTYTVKVIPYDVNGVAGTAKTASYKTSAVTISSLKATPTYTTKSTGYRADSVYLTWSAANATSNTTYTVYRSTSKSGTYKNIGKATSTYFYDDTVAPNKSYYYKVRPVAAKSTDGYSPAYTGGLSSVANVKTDSIGTSYLYTSFNDDNKIELSFYNGSSFKSGYEIWRSTKKNSGYKKLCTVSASTYVDSTAKSGTTYYYKVRAYYYEASGKKMYYGTYSTPKGVKFVMGGIDLTATQTGTTAVKVSWDKVSGANSYELYYKTDMTGDAYKLLKSTTGTSYTKKQLDSSGTYYFQLRACKNQNGVKTYYTSTTASVSLGLHSPNAYISKRTYTYSANKLTVKTTISWDKVYGVGGYKIQQYKDGTWTTVKKLTKTTTKYTITNTYSSSSDASYYEYRVVAYKGSEEYSSVVWYTIGLKNVSGLIAYRSKKTNAAVLEWDKNNAATSYSIYRTTPTGDTQYLGSTTSTMYTDSTLTPGVEYTYEVVPYNNKIYLSGDSSYGTESRFVTFTLSLAATTIGSAKNTASKTATIAWKKNTAATKYIVYRSTKKGSGYKKIATTSKLSYKDTKLTKGKTYYYKVVAATTNDAGLTVQSNPSAAKSVKITK